MLKRMVIMMVAVITVVFGAIEVSADASDMTEAKLLLIDETKNEIERSNRVIEEKELDDSKYYSELGDIEERFDGLEIDIEQKLVVNGDLYIIEYVCSYDYDNVAYDVDKVWLYSERDDKWFSDDDDFVDVVNARYPEIW
ncbi:hypothetical protein [Blautia glucerasea]|uniref:hypothetical protein n=1 Tax=Blautia glucerasea TaxID=536633 RepID=UPI00157072F4|nr:hypothetical protein [Blautia glucerasea]NSJ25475.1 hypothetical protein [Blautia glucerasea]